MVLLLHIVFLAWTYDRAENDAIESGAEEVEQLEQVRLLSSFFICSK